MKTYYLNGKVNQFEESPLAENLNHNFKLMVNLTPDPVVIKNGNGEVIECNNAACDFFQYPYSELIGKPFKDLLPLNQAKQFPSFLSEAMFIDNEFKNQSFCKSNGKVIKAQLKSISTIIDDQQIYIDYIRDLSEVQSLENELKKMSSELSRMIIDQNKFITIIAHDLKGYLNSVVGFSDLILNDEGNYDKENILNFISIIRQAGVSGFSILENTLHWIRSQNGHVDAIPQNFILNKLVENVVGTLKPQMIKKKIDLVINQSKDFSVFADNIMMEVVVRNLVSNAIKFSPKNEKIEIFLNHRNNNVLLTIKDRGVGIPENFKDHIFKVNISRDYIRKGTDNECGTGFGLAICKEFILKNKGDLWFESIENQGSSFHLTLPSKIR